MEIIVGALIGYCIGIVAFVFFDDEIFAAIDWMRDTVRRALRLDT